MKIISTIFGGIFIIVLVLVSSLFLVPLLPFQNNIQIKIVESGSMEPTILTGSLVIIRPATTYSVGDVVTFESTSADVPTTHRIIGVREEAGQTFFMTKGDANEEADTQETALRSVIGKVVIAVPYVGFILDFARQPIGFGLLIVLPALLIIMSEIEKILSEVRKKAQQKRTIKLAQIKVPDYRGEPDVLPTTKVRMMDIARPVSPKIQQLRPVSQSVAMTPAANYVLSTYILPIIIVFSSVLFVATSFTGSTVSYFNDIESALANVLKASALDFTVSTNQNSFILDPNASTDVVIEPTVSIQKGSASAAYDVSIEVVSASSTLCGALLVDSTLPFLYSGSLVALSATTLVFNDDWGLTVSLDPNVQYVPGDVCSIDLVYTARRDGADNTAGYIDIEKLPLQFSTPLQVAPIVAPLLKLVEPIIETEPPLPVEEIIDPLINNKPVADPSIIDPLPPEDPVIKPEPVTPEPAPQTEEAIIEPIPDTETPAL